MLSKYVDSLLIAYMSGVDRDPVRVDEFGEFFTPDSVVEHMLDQMDPALFADLDQPFIDPTCGDGQFLAMVMKRKLEHIADQNNGDIPLADFACALESIYGVEYHADNAALCRKRLLCGHTEPELIDIVNRNIVCADATTYNFTFDGTSTVIEPVDRLFDFG